MRFRACLRGALPTGSTGESGNCVDKHDTEQHINVMYTKTHQAQLIHRSTHIQLWWPAEEEKQYWTRVMRRIWLTFWPFNCELRLEKRASEQILRAQGEKRKGSDNTKRHFKKKLFKEINTEKCLSWNLYPLQKSSEEVNIKRLPSQFPEFTCFLNRYWNTHFHIMHRCRPLHGECRI